MSEQKQRLTFISYSRADSEFALELAKVLRSSGFYIWLDQLDIPTGARWDDEVEKALLECEIFMVILTPDSIASNNVKDEIGYAIDSNKHIMPILLENAVLPFRLRRFQYVDFTKKSYEDGIEAAKQLLRKLLSVSPASVSLTQVDDMKKEATPLPGALEKKSSATDSIEDQRAKAIQQARERERLERERQAQVAHSIPAVPRQVAEPQPRGKPSAKTVPLVAGAGFFSIVCLIAGWVILHPLIIPPATEIPVTTQVTEATISATLPSPTSTSTATPRPVDTLTVTPFAPQAPDQFLIFYFDTLIYKRDHQLAWSLLTEKFKAENNPKGFDDWKATWSKVVEWERPTMTVSSINASTVSIRVPEIRFRSTSWYSVPCKRGYCLYCLIRDESRNTWVIESNSVCRQ